MLDGVVVPLFQAIYTLLHFAAGIFWTINQALLIVGYYLMALTNWLVTDAFKPVINQIINQTDGLLAPIFTIAMLVLAITYLLSVFAEIKIVDLRSSILWLFFAVFIFQFAPELYAGSEQLRRGLGGAFYEAGVHSLANESGSIEGLDSIGVSPQVAMETPSNQFGVFVPYDTAIDGLDIAMAYLYADGCDVLRASGCIEMGWLPLEWYMPGSDHAYFENTRSADFYPIMTNDERQDSLSRAGDGIWRAFSGMIVSFFGLLEQIVHLVLAMAMGFSFISLGIAVLFAFFKRTETITWAVFNMIIELFVQSIVTSLLLSIILTFVIIGAGTGNAVLLLGSSFVMIIFMILLIRGALGALTRSINGMVGAMSTAVGGTLGSVTGTASDVMGGMGTGLGAAAALYRGASYGQALGILAAGNQTITRAAQYGQYAFGPDSALGSLSADIFAGASAANLVGAGAAGFLIDTHTDDKDTPTTGAQASNTPDENRSQTRASQRRSQRPSQIRALVSTVRADADEDDAADNDSDEGQASASSNHPARADTVSRGPTADTIRSRYKDDEDFSISAMPSNGKALGEGLPPLPEVPPSTPVPLPDHQFKPADIEFLAGIEQAFPGSTGFSFNAAGELSSSDIAKIDASDDDDFANLSAELTAAVSSQRTKSSSPLSGSRSDLPDPAPVSSVEPARERSDDLTAIRGIGPNTQRRLNEAGIQTYSDLAATSPEALQAIEPRLKTDRAERMISDSASLASSPESASPTDERSDDLTVIRGIGSNTQRRLNDAGIQTYDDLAAASPEALQGLVPRLSAENASRFVADAALLAQTPEPTTQTAQGQKPLESATGAESPAVSSPTSSTSGTERPVIESSTPSSGSTSSAIEAAGTGAYGSANASSDQNTVAAPDQIAAAVDATNNDDNARLMSGMAALSANTAPDFSALASGLAAALSGSASSIRYSTPTSEAASTVSLASGGAVPNLPEVGQYARLASAMHLPPETAASVIQNTAAQGSMGADMASSVRTALSGVTTSSGQSLDTATINSAVNGLQQAASAMVSAVNAAGSANNGSAATADPTAQTSEIGQSSIQVNMAASIGRAATITSSGGNAGHAESPTSPGLSSGANADA